MPAKSRVYRRPFLFAATFVATLACTHSYADSIKSSRFLKYSEGQKHWYYAGFFDALGSWSTLNKAENAQCVWGWLADKPKERKTLLDKSFEAYPDHAPEAVIIALVQRDCGPIAPPQQPATTQN